MVVLYKQKNFVYLAPMVSIKTNFTGLVINTGLNINIYNSDKLYNIIDDKYRCLNIQTRKYIKNNEKNIFCNKIANNLNNKKIYIYDYDNREHHQRLVEKDIIK